MGTPSDNRLPKDTTTGMPISQSQLFGENPSGIVEPLSLSNPMPMAGVSLSIARGLVPGQALFEKFGRKDSINSADPAQDVWNGSGLYTGQPTGAAEKLTAVSSDVNDAAAGTGLRTIRLFGQLAGVEQEEDIILNGTTPVLSTKLWDRMYRVRGLTAGSGDFNAGAITIAHETTTANIFSVVPIGANRSQIAAFTVPAGKRLYLDSIDTRIIRANGGLGSGTAALMQRDSGGIWEQTHTIDINTNGPASLKLGLSESYDPLTDFVMRVLNVTDNATSCTAQMFGNLVDV